MTTIQEERKKVLEKFERFTDLIELDHRPAQDLLTDLADLIQDVSEIMADGLRVREPYAENTIDLLREGSDTIARRLGVLEEGE